MAEKGANERNASKTESGPPPGLEGTPPLSWRRQVALTILSAHVQRQGGLGTDGERVPISRVMWAYADAFLEAEHAPPPAPPKPPPAPVRELSRARPDHPSDEWGVRDGDRLKRGFMTRGEAEYYASARHGATVVQISGPEVTAARIAGGGGVHESTVLEPQQS